MATRHARDAALALILGAGGTLALTFAPAEMVPLRLVCLAATAFGVLGFVKDMGASKRLNRAGLVAFAFAALAKVMVLVGSGGADRPRSYVLYAFALLASVLFWSLAFLHRDKDVKFAGAIGAAASALPILALIAGHMALGAGAVIGLDVLYDFTTARSEPGLALLLTIEGMFLLWAALAARMLWTGRLAGA